MIKIVLPTDFSENAYNAARYALRLFKNSPCTFYLLHTYTPAVYQAEYLMNSSSRFDLGEVYETNSLTQLEKFRERLEKDFPSPQHSFAVHSAFNNLIDEVNEFVELNNIDLIVMGTQGATGAKEIFIGTHTIHMVKRAKVPVLAIPPNFEYEVPKEILFPTDYDINFKRKPLAMLLHIAKEHLSSIEILHVSYGYELSEKQVANKNKLNTVLSGTAHLFHNWPNQEVIQAINNFQLKHKTQLLVMVKNKHTFVERIFIQPVIKKIGFHITIPFMVIPHFK